MNTSSRLLGTFALLLGLAGCGHLDVAPPGNPDRVLNGSVRAPAVLPAGSEVVVRLIATPPPDAVMVRKDLPVAARVATPIAERLLGEHRQVLGIGTTDPVPFQIAYHADDDLLRRGVNIDVRISQGGRLRYRTVSAHILTLASAPFPQEVAVQPVQ